MRLSLVLLCALLLAGCASVSTTTKIAANGSFTRTAKYSQMDFDMSALGGNAKGSGTPKKLDDAFRIPTAGEGVTVERTHDDKMGNIVTVSRSIPAGAPPITDIVLLDETKKPRLSSAVLVQRLSDGTLEYTETLRWLGERKGAPFNQAPPELRARVKKALPTRLAETATIDAVTHLVLISMVHAFLGPSDPVFTSLPIPAVNDAMARRVKVNIYNQMMPALQAKYSMTPAEARHVFDSVYSEKDLENMSEKSTPNSPMGTNNNSNSMFVPLSFTVSCQGRVVRTNGLIDPVNGEVYWSLYDLSVEVEDVTLDVVVDPRG